VLVINFSFYAKDFLNFSTIPFGTGFYMGHVCMRLTDLIGVGSWFGSFTVSGLYPSYVAGILKHVVEINLYVLLMTN
jgi:hypothetical protein